MVAARLGKKGVFSSLGCCLAYSLLSCLVPSSMLSIVSRASDTDWYKVEVAYSAILNQNVYVHGRGAHVHFSVV